MAIQAYNIEVLYRVDRRLFGTGPLSFSQQSINLILNAGWVGHTLRTLMSDDGVTDVIEAPCVTSDTVNFPLIHWFVASDQG